MADPLTDPTNARLRDFDIPVIMPRFDLAELPPFDDRVMTDDITPSGQTAGRPNASGGKDGAGHR
ncbi:MAG TPA: hypothetical protein VGJ07_01550 [Rugosimonospora sp.]